MAAASRAPLVSLPVGYILQCIKHVVGRRSGHPKVKKKEDTMFKTLATKLHAWRRFRESVRELSRLSDRELNDLGIGRSDIEEVVRQGARLHG
jgi:uncharacterized protein YjiS (DUF1127 family)